MVEPYLYRVLKVLRVVDADTVDLRLDVGFRHTIEDRFRLYGIDAPEVRGAERMEGLVASQWLHDRLFSLDIDRLFVRTHKDERGKYGRWLGELLDVGEEGTVNINDELVGKGYAIPM